MALQKKLKKTGTSRQMFQTASCWPKGGIHLQLKVIGTKGSVYCLKMMLTMPLMKVEKMNI